MKIKWLPLVAILTMPAWIAACGEPPAPEVPAQPPVAAEPAPPAAEPVVVAPEVLAPPAPVKPGKEKIVGKWQFSFEGEPKTKAEADAQKKFPKDKDASKREALVKKIADEAAGEWIEFGDGVYTSHVTAKGKDKVVLKVKYDVPKDDPSAITMTPVGKDEISKKEIKGVEVAVTFADENTIQMVDPKKKMTLIFKRK